MSVLYGGTARHSTDRESPIFENVGLLLIFGNVTNKIFKMYKIKESRKKLKNYATRCNKIIKGKIIFSIYKFFYKEEIVQFFFSF